MLLTIPAVIWKFSINVDKSNTLAPVGIVNVVVAVFDVMAVLFIDKN